MAAGETRCPKCGAGQSIITMPLEVIPADTGAPEAEPESAIEPAAGELLPAEDEALDVPRRVTGGVSTGTSFTTSTSRSGASGHARAEVKIELPQELIDPENHLSPTAYWKLMRRWSEGIAREIEAASDGGSMPGVAEAAQRVALPFGPDCGGDLPPAIRDTMTQRARRQLTRLGAMPTPADVFGPHAAPDADSAMRELLEAAGRGRRRRGLTVTCGSLMGGVLAAVVGACLAGWVAWS